MTTNQKVSIVFTILMSIIMFTAIYLGPTIAYKLLYEDKVRVTITEMVAKEALR